MDQREQPIIIKTARRSRAPRRTTLSLAMTPMIDVVFLLLIYFLVATDFRMGEEVYRMDLPQREGAGPRDPFQLDEEPLRIAVNSTGIAPTMYTLHIDGPYPQPATFGDLHAFLSEKQVDGAGVASAAGALFRREHPIVVQPTRNTTWEQAMEAFNAAARARYTNITFGKTG